MPLDVTVDGEIDSAFDLLKREWGSLDIVIHAVAFAPREALAGSFVESTEREAFRIAHDVSSYSFTALARRAAPLMAGRQGRCSPCPISVPSARSRATTSWASPRRASRPTFAFWPRPRAAGNSGQCHLRRPHQDTRSSGIPGFRKMLSRVAEVAPLRRNVTQEDVGNAAAFLCSDLAAGITGEILYVDSGFNTVGMSFPHEAEG